MGLAFVQPDSFLTRNDQLGVVRPGNHGHRLSCSPIDTLAMS